MAKRRDAQKSISPQTPFTFVDVFAGCGGLSLGLMQAGWKGLFAVERDLNAFETLRTNLLAEAGRYKFDWPKDLPAKALSIDSVLRKHGSLLKSLQGKVDLLVGGPPCQGFSTAGRRDPADPRNKLVKSYLRLVGKLQPRIVLIENVRGITADFVDSRKPGTKINYAIWIQKALGESYKVSTRLIDTSQYGVPQKRLRFFVVAIRKDIAFPNVPCPFTVIESQRHEFLKSKSINVVPVSSQSAISDLEVERNGTTDSRDTPGFEEIEYKGPLTRFQKLLNDGFGGSVSDTRLARHNSHIQSRFKKLITLCHQTGRLNTSLPKEVRESFGLQKCAIRVMDPEMPAPTITSMPDDLIHYKEPRCLTVRENARLQSFPDWFQFKGKYTTGGLRRRKEVPRFTQVANAVPPLIAEAIGIALSYHLDTMLTSLKNPSQ